MKKEVHDHEDRVVYIKNAHISNTSAHDLRSLAVGLPHGKSERLVATLHLEQTLPLKQVGLQSRSCQRKSGDDNRFWNVQNPRRSKL